MPGWPIRSMPCFKERFIHNIVEIELNIDHRCRLVDEFEDATNIITKVYSINRVE